MYLPISLSSKRVLVTGAGRGLGKEIVKALVERQATVFALSKTQSKLEELKKEIPQVTTLQADLQNWEQTREIVKGIGTVHHLVNNAAVSVGGPFLKMSPEGFDKTVYSNIRSTINVSQIVMEDMVKRGEGGSVVTISSVAAKIPSSNLSLYAASKLNQIKSKTVLLNQTMSMEMGNHNTRVNTVNPGLFDSYISKPVIENPTGHFYTTNMEGQHLKRLITKKEIANTVLFLLSDFSSGITGQSIRRNIRIER